MKSEPEVFGIDHLKACPNAIDKWDGVRNYQARNMMRDQMKKNDLAFFYHSNCKVPGIVGIIKIVKEGYIDETAFDPKQKYYDSKSSRENPRWFCVDVKYVKKLRRTISLTELKNIPELSKMPLLRKGNRLSIMPVTALEWETILSME